MATEREEFVLGLDLDGVVADFYGYMRQIAAEWKGVPVETLDEHVRYGFPEWNLVPGEYDRLHRFAVTQRDLFSNVPVIPGAPQAIRRLGTEGVRIRIITHRLFIRHFHQMAVQQTVGWLDRHAVPYWDLCFMRDKQLVNADLYLEDSPANIKCLESHGQDVITFTNSTNILLSVMRRANEWSEAESEIRRTYYHWLAEKGKPMPTGHGCPPPKK